MNEQQERVLIAGLKSLAASTRDGASARVEQAVLAEMGQLQKPLSTNRAWLPLAAGLLLATTSGVWIARSAPDARPQPAAPWGFVDVPGAAGLPPMESGTIVRVTLPVTALSSYGIAFAPDISTDSVEADLLVAQDGVTRAVRLVNDSTTSRSTP